MQTMLEVWIHNDTNIIIIIIMAMSRILCCQRCILWFCFFSISLLLFGQWPLKISIWTHTTWPYSKIPSSMFWAAACMQCHRVISTFSLCLNVFGKLQPASQPGLFDVDVASRRCVKQWFLLFSKLGCWGWMNDDDAARIRFNAARIQSIRLC